MVRIRGVQGGEDRDREDMMTEDNNFLIFYCVAII